MDEKLFRELQLKYAKFNVENMDEILKLREQSSIGHEWMLYCAIVIFIFLGSSIYYHKSSNYKDGDEGFVFVGCLILGLASLLLLLLAYIYSTYPSVESIIRMLSCGI